jgi:predicted DNA-binding protein (UPF0251 family)
MPRPLRCRRVCCPPIHRLFKPQKIPARYLDIIDLRLDELEALRLADMTGLTQLQAAKQMDVSQPTYNRILRSAREKVTRSIVDGCALRIQADGQNEAIQLSAEGRVDMNEGREGT